VDHITVLPQVGVDHHHPLTVVDLHPHKALPAVHQDRPEAAEEGKF
jgi:hypothetical protein